MSALDTSAQFFKSYFSSSITAEKKLENISNFRNISIIAHVDHGKTTLTDNLLAQVGLINKALAGEQLATDCFELEAKRGITINSTNVSFKYKQCLFNLIDSPGHVEFNAEVIKALRSSDGAILVVDIVDGIMPQTETVLGQALNEGLDIILFINKVDRIVTEKFYTSKEIYERMTKTISKINDLVKKLTEKDTEYFNLGKNVVFGSALFKWGASLKSLAQKKVSFETIVEGIINKQNLNQNFNLAECLLDCCVSEVKSPKETQKDKIERLYSVLTKDRSKEVKEILEESNLPDYLQSCDPEAPFVGIVTDLNYDVHSGMLATVRVLSGTYSKKMSLYSSSNNYEAPIKSPTRIMVSAIKKYYDVDSCYAGSLITFQGCDLDLGSTLSDRPLNYTHPNMSYARTPVIAFSIKPVKAQDLRKMLDCVKLLCLEDPSLACTTDLDSKEFLLYGIGVLHLEVSISKLELIYGVKVQHSEPIVAYSETIPQGEVSRVISVRTSNKLNDFDMYVFKLPDSLVQKLLKQEVTNKLLVQACEVAGLEKDLARSAVKILDNGSIYFNCTKGCSFMDETKDNLTAAMELAMSTGYKMNKPIKGLGFVLTYAKIHEDGLHRGVNQFRSAFRKGLEQIFEEKNPILVEPIMELVVEAPYPFLSQISSLISLQRGYVEDVVDSNIGGYFKQISVIPLAETFVLPSMLMSATEGRVLFDLTLKGYQEIPPEVLKKIKL